MTRHNYLWKTLAAFRLPQFFIKTIKSLYQNAQTTVAINGELSVPNSVKCGVRQGDPLSCFLFNIGIEPLACMIQTSDQIRGFRFPGVKEKLAINLFADNTIIYVNKDNKYSDLNIILDRWCEALGAKFNFDKTEIIPIGTKRHRERIYQTWKIHPLDPPLDPDIHITNDGEAICSLGAWV